MNIVKDHIKSFVRRKGRITKRQYKALQQYLSLYEIPYSSPLNLQLYFKNKLPIIVEIGFGMGNSLIKMSKNYLNKNFIGIEVYDPGIGNILYHIHNHKLDNLKIMKYDAVDIFKNCIHNNTLAGVQIFFPDPWTKKRHRKRRLINSNFIELIVKKLKNDGFIHIATDITEYADIIFKLLTNNLELYNSSDKNLVLNYNRRDQTKFELRGKKFGNKISDIIFHKY